MFSPKPFPAIPQGLSGAYATQLRAVAHASQRSPYHSESVTTKHNYQYSSQGQHDHRNGVSEGRHRATGAFREKGEPAHTRRERLVDRKPTVEAHKNEHGNQHKNDVAYRGSGSELFIREASKAVARAVLTVRQVVHDQTCKQQEKQN